MVCYHQYYSSIVQTIINEILSGTRFIKLLVSGLLRAPFNIA